MAFDLKPSSIPKEGSGELMGGLPKKGYLRDSVQTWNERTNKYEAGWEHRFNKRFKFVFKDNYEITSDAEFVSDSFFCAPYRNALIFLNVSYEATNTQTLHFEVEFSDDNVNFYPCWLNWWGYDQIVAAMMPHRDCMPIPILAPYIRIKFTSTGTGQGTNLYLTCFGIFNGV